MNESTAGPKWKRWLSRFEHGLVASKITDKGQMKALLLCHVGDRVYEIYESVADKADDFDGVVKKLNTHFNPRRSEVSTLRFQNHSSSRERQSSRLLISKSSTNRNFKQ